MEKQFNLNVAVRTDDLLPGGLEICSHEFEAPNNFASAPHRHFLGAFKQCHKVLFCANPPQQLFSYFSLFANFEGLSR
jgi:hypothetical protein